MPHCHCKPCLRLCQMGCPILLKEHLIDWLMQLARQSHCNAYCQVFNTLIEESSLHICCWNLSDGLKLRNCDLSDYYLPLAVWRAPYIYQDPSHWREETDPCRQWQLGPSASRLVAAILTMMMKSWLPTDDSRQSVLYCLSTTYANNNNIITNLN